MEELFGSIIEWIKNSGFAEFASISSLLTTIGAIIGIATNLKKTTIREIQASAKQIQTSKEYSDTIGEIETIKQNVLVVNETMERLSGMLLVVLNNSKISADAKQKALDIINATNNAKESVVRKVDDVSTVVANVASEVEKQIKQEMENNVETNPYVNNLQDLIEK